MNEKICMFCGHRDIINKAEIEYKVTEIIKDLIENKSVNIFYTGGMGDFDNICSKCVRKFKEKYSNIKLCLIIPYMTKDILRNGKYYYSLYDEIIEPDMGDIFPKGAIAKRNRWMVDKSDYMVVYVKSDYGGAYNTMKYALKNNRAMIINI